MHSLAAIQRSKPLSPRDRWRFLQTQDATIDTRHPSASHACQLTGSSPPEAGKLSFTRLWRASSLNKAAFVKPDIITLYVLRGLKNRKRYIGISNDLVRRLEGHRQNTSKGSQLIGEFELVLTEEYPTYLAAREREKFLKSGQCRQ
jgi:predicted GIY-YIG superfamily endonuclease